MNVVMLMGRLTRDPEIKYTGDNKAIARYSIAVDRKYKDQEGKYPTDFFHLVSFGKTAEFIEKYVHKGTKIVAQGEIQNNNYEKNGNKVYQDQIIINSVEFAESKNAHNNPDATDNTGLNQTEDGFNQIEGDENDLPFV